MNDGSMSSTFYCLTVIADRGMQPINPSINQKDPQQRKQTEIQQSLRAVGKLSQIGIRCLSGCFNNHWRFFLNDVYGLFTRNLLLWHSRQLMARLVFTFEYQGREHRARGNERWSQPVGRVNFGQRCGSHLAHSKGNVPPSAVKHSTRQKYPVSYFHGE